MSVIIPTYNRCHLLSEAIESVIRQDVKDCGLEIIVVDDGSTDDTADVVKSFGSRVRYLYQKNRGAGVARNHGIEAATGEWIAFLDSDDRWLRNKLSLQFAALEAFPDYRAVHSNFYTFCGESVSIEDGLRFWLKCADGSDKIDWLDIYGKAYDSSGLARVPGNPERPLRIYGGNLFSALLARPCATCITLLIARDSLTPEMRFAENYPTWEDYWFFCRLSERHDLLFLDIPTAENRAHTGPRLTQAKVRQTLECYIDMCDKIYIPSTSPHRPPTETILQRRRMANTALFKEYLKDGYVSKARAMIHPSRLRTEFALDFPFVLYGMASWLPLNPTHRLVRLKRALAPE